MSATPRARIGAGHVVIGLIAAVFALGWGWWMWTAAGGSGVRAQVLSFSVNPDNSLTVAFAVAGAGAGEHPVTCRVRALDTSHAVVGTTEVTLPPGTTRTSLRLPATTRPTAADVGDCRLSPPQ